MSEINNALGFVSDDDRQFAAERLGVPELASDPSPSFAELCAALIQRLEIVSFERENFEVKFRLASAQANLRKAKDQRKKKPKAKPKLQKRRTVVTKPPRS